MAGLGSWAQDTQEQARVKAVGTIRRLVRYKIVPEVLTAKCAEGPANESARAGQGAET